MSDHPFLQFINLVAFDQKIQFFENEKNSIVVEIAATKKQQEEYERGICDMKDHVVLLKKRVNEQELEMKILDQKEKEKKQRLENLSDYKEYQIIKAEVEFVQRMQVEQERVVLDAWNQLENAQIILQKKTIESKEQLQRLQERLQELEKKAAHLQDDIAHFLVQRSEKEASVPAEWLEKYIMMRARVANPVVEIFHQTCGACSQMITSQDMVRAKRGAIVQCQKCFRLLYAPEIMEKHDS
jgi:predicted  nucleic acid-binding Zn-ribbon protein